MVKFQIASFSLPEVPPGFPPQAPKTRTSSAAALESSRNQNPTCKENGFLPVHGLGQMPDFSAEPRRVSSRKRTQPQFYRPPIQRQPATSPRRRGRPPKTSSMSQFSLQKTQKSFINEVSSRLQDPDQMTQEQSRSKSTNQVGEHGSQVDNSTLPYDRVGRETNMYGKTCGISVFYAQDIDEDLASVLEAINRKHGDIAQDCSLESHCMKTLVLLGICKMVQDLQEKQLKDIDINGLDSYQAAVRDAGNMKVNVQWLHNRLDEIKDAVNLSIEAKGMVNERNMSLENFDTKQKELALRGAELERLASEVQVIEKQLAQDVVMVEELNKKLGGQNLRRSQFHHSCLMDGLIN